MTYALPSPVRLDTDTAAGDGGAVFNVFQVIGINLVCFFSFTGVAMLFGVIWWGAILIGWLSASVATLPITALVILLWPVASGDIPARTTHANAADMDTQALLRMWDQDLEEEHDAALLAAANPGHPAPTGWDADIDHTAEALFQKAGSVFAGRKAA